MIVVEPSMGRKDRNMAKVASIQPPGPGGREEPQSTCAGGMGGPLIVLETLPCGWRRSGRAAHGGLIVPAPDQEPLPTGRRLHQRRGFLTDPPNATLYPDSRPARQM